MVFKPGQSGNPKGTFKKGVSGNPSGRPKGYADLEEMARAQTPAALKTLAEIMANKKAPAAARIAAANAYLDRGWGKPKQSIESTGKDGAPLIPEYTEEERARALAVFLARNNLSTST